MPNAIPVSHSEEVNFMHVSPPLSKFPKGTVFQPSHQCSQAFELKCTLKTNIYPEAEIAIKLICQSAEENT